MKWAYLVVWSLLAGAPSAFAADAPPMPYLDWAACPFECCVYREWTAVTDTTALSQRDRSSKTAFVIPAGARITAVSGVVVTTRPGRIVATAPTTLGEDENRIRLKAGDEIFLLRPMGEGFGRYWYRGRLVALELFPDSLGPVPGNAALRVLQLPTTEWWIKLRNKSGQVGWSVWPEAFTNNDSCA